MIKLLKLIAHHEANKWRAIHHFVVTATRWRVGVQLVATMYQFVVSGLLLVHYQNFGYGGFALFAAITASIALISNGNLIWPLRMFLLIPQQFSLIFILVFKVWQFAQGRYESEDLLLVLLCVMYTIAIAHDMYLRIATHTLRAK